jgi:hypothetical protein
MPPLAVDRHVVAAAAGQRIHEGRGRLERGALLIERGHCDVRAQTHRARVGRKSAGQKVDESRLASAVGADDSDPVATHDAKRKVAHDRALAIRFADPLGVDHQGARRFGVLRNHGGDADRSQGFAALAS